MDSAARYPHYSGAPEARSSPVARLLRRLLGRPDPAELPLLHAITAGIHAHTGAPPPRHDQPFSPAERTLADILDTVAHQFELGATPVYSRLYDPLAAEYCVRLHLGHGYVLEGSYANVLVQNAYPDRGCVVLQRLPDRPHKGSGTVLRTATFQCAQTDEQLARTTLDVLRPALGVLRGA